MMQQKLWKPARDCEITLIVLLVTMTAQLTFGFECGLLNNNFLTATNVILKNFVYKNKTVLNHVICGRDCSMDTICKSFNFQEDIKLCELSNASRVDHPNNLIEEKGSVYFDEFHDTPLFSKPDRCLEHFRSCKKLKEAGHLASGVYFICPDGFDELQVYCDMESDGGGWIVFQRRQDGSVDFYRGWDEYKSGFGSLSGEFWLGNDNLVGLTSDESHGGWELRVDLEDGRNGNTAWAQYGQFKIVGEKYSLHASEYQGTAGNALSWQNTMNFTTKDMDNDNYLTNCATKFEGAWWFNGCITSHLNGNHFKDWKSVGTKGIKWYGFPGNTYSVSLKKCSMKIREKK